ncbi:hypothetical protein OROHE_014535 [Orobanche hederae]
MKKVRCQRIGCDAVFCEDDNLDGSCTYHDAGPIFHDGMKEWSCCKKKSHDFSSFLEIPGCSLARDLKPKSAVSGSSERSQGFQVPQPPHTKKIADINQPQICKNKGCGRNFKEKDNHDTACTYHPGPPVFHDRMRGWKCCDVHVKEFDEFMSIPPCTKGWHSADPVS